MAICNSIPPELADRISSELNGVANMLRAMRSIAITSETTDQMSACCVVVQGLAERCHLMLDDCIVAMGNDMGIGNFRPAFKKGAVGDYGD